MEILSPIQARVLACLMEKKETTPDQYPLTLNALRNACNQKSSRDPVSDYSEGEIGHTLRELEGLGLVREEWGARAPKYQHMVGKAWDLHSKGIALICVLMLRGPQTLAELKTRTQRLFDFDQLQELFDRGRPHAQRHSSQRLDTGAQLLAVSHGFLLRPGLPLGVPGRDSRLSQESLNKSWVSGIHGQ